MNKSFTPFHFLASLGAGGISVAPFAMFQYFVPHGPGLTTISQVVTQMDSPLESLLYPLMMLVMVIFGSIHLGLTAFFWRNHFLWRKTPERAEVLRDPLRNSALLTPWLSLAMTFNVFIGSVRFFIPAFHENLQLFMLPALVAWLVLWLVVMNLTTLLQKMNFATNFDINKISFGWLIQPFTLAMVSVTGSGIAAMSVNSGVANVAAFFSIISFTMAAFLLLVKTTSLFKSHFAAPGLPEKQFLPSYLIVVPIVTLLAITGYRLGHYTHLKLQVHTELFSLSIVALAFAFQSWYLIFGLRLLSGYFRKHFFRDSFHVSQWGLICPFVAYAVLGAFFNHVIGGGSYLIFGLSLISLATAVFLYSRILLKQAACAGFFGSRKLAPDCA